VTTLIWNPLWQLSAPDPFDLNANGSTTFKGPVGDVFLPEDYLLFMQTAGGAALRDRGSWFLAKFLDEQLVCEIEWLGNTSSVMFATWDFYTEPEKNLLPQQFISIGYAEVKQHKSEKYKANDGCNVVMCADTDSADYGKVFIWIKPAQSLENVDAWMKGNNSLGIGYVADSFNDFMNNFKPATELG